MELREYLDSLELEAKEGDGAFWKGVRFVIKQIRAFMEREKPELTLKEVKEFCKRKESCNDCPFEDGKFCAVKSIPISWDIPEIERRVRE